MSSKFLLSDGNCCCFCFHRCAIESTISGMAFYGILEGWRMEAGWQMHFRAGFKLASASCPARWWQLCLALLTPRSHSLLKRQWKVMRQKSEWETVGNIICTGNPTQSLIFWAVFSFQFSVFSSASIYLRWKLHVNRKVVVKIVKSLFLSQSALGANSWEGKR